MDGKSKTEIAFELLKIFLLSWLLWVAFNDARIPDVFWKPLANLAQGGLVVFAYIMGRHFAVTYKEWWKNYLLVFYGVGILVIMLWAGYGTHVEDADPLFGGGERVIDFIPKPFERDEYAVTIFLTLLIPALYGVYKVRNEP